MNSGLPRTNPASVQGGAGLELGTSELQVQRSNDSAKLPPSKQGTIRVNVF